MKSNFDCRLSILSSKTLHIGEEDSNITPAELDRIELVLVNIHKNEYFSTEKAILRKKVKLPNNSAIIIEIFYCETCKKQYYFENVVKKKLLEISISNFACIFIDIKRMKSHS